MGALLRCVDHWYALAQETAPGRFEDAHRLELLGHLVRLVALRLHGFRDLPAPGDVRCEAGREGITLTIRSAGHVPFHADVLERQLATFGFHVESQPGTQHREIVLQCRTLKGGTVLTFPEMSREAHELARKRRRWKP